MYIQVCVFCSLYVCVTVCVPNGQCLSRAYKKVVNVKSHNITHYLGIGHYLVCVEVCVYVSVCELWLYTLRQKTIFIH